MFLIQDDFNRSYVDKDSGPNEIKWTPNIKKAKQFFVKGDATFWCKYFNGYVPSAIVFPQV